MCEHGGGIEAFDIRLPRGADAERSAVMSRDFMEHGLGWGWDAARVARSIRNGSTSVVVAEHGGDVVGFGAMKYADLEAHLLLFGVEPIWRNRGVGTQLLGWL